MTINRFLLFRSPSPRASSGLHQAGWYDVALTGGVESMTKVKMGGDRPAPNPSAMQSRPEIYTPMGVTSENVAESYGITREDQDLFALSSHQKPLQQSPLGDSPMRSIPVQTRVYKNGSWTDLQVDTDEGPSSRHQSSSAWKARSRVQTRRNHDRWKLLSGLRRCLRDPADVGRKSHALGADILGSLRSYAVKGVAPEIMGIGPAVAIPAAIEKAGLSLRGHRSL